MVIATLHILCAFFVIFLIFMVSGFIAENSSRKKLDEVLERAVVEMGLSKKDVLDGKHSSELASYLSERYSSDKFVNRLSDMFRPILTFLEVVGYLAQLGVIVLAAWFTFTDDIEFAKIAWFAVPVALFFLFINRILFWVCYLLTGRATGEARDVRNMLPELIKED
ncbi:hypothetical protein HOP52_17895 [Halomonas campisalis]|uniref:Uncharacterized protein n=1 Tax=Billgrantia campisalis TaxID=74661 RepID=A0ABS9PCZ2_9GAMM|nr:hypothetical protein [Halomonas campisalis]MCG6659626.1 hypothetical protein [Halomonas campisalis]MDR5865105.1 hypothetical protein [Halomonas campisalis]